MKNSLWLCLAVICLAGMTADPAAALNRLFERGDSGLAITYGYNFHEYEERRIWQASASWRGRIDGSVKHIDGDGMWSERIAGAIDLAVIRSAHFGFEVGFMRLWRTRNDTHTDWLPIRMYWRLGLGRDLTLIPHGTLTLYLGDQWQNFRGDLGLDMTWRFLRVGADILINEDFRYHDVTLRLGAILRF